MRALVPTLVQAVAVLVHVEAPVAMPTESPKAEQGAVLVQSDGGQCEQLWPVTALPFGSGCVADAGAEWSMPAITAGAWARQCGPSVPPSMARRSGAATVRTIRQDLVTRPNQWVDAGETITMKDNMPFPMLARAAPVAAHSARGRVRLPSTIGYIARLDPARSFASRVAKVRYEILRSDRRPSVSAGSRRDLFGRLPHV